MIESIDFVDEQNNIITAYCNDGKVSMDRRVYEQNSAPFSVVHQQKKYMKLLYPLQNIWRNIIEPKI